MSSPKLWSHRSIVARIAAGLFSLLLVACGDDPGVPQGAQVDVSPAPMPGPAREATICGARELTAPDGSVVEQPEYYYFEAINEKLATYDGLREFVALSSVNDCAEARRFTTGYNEYLRQRPDAPTADPNPDLDQVPVRPGSEDSPEQVTEKIQAGPVSSNPAVVLLPFPATNISCSGISIASYGLVTAAHCMGPADGWQLMNVIRQAPNGSYLFVRNGPIWIFWTHHPSYNGSADPPDDVAVGMIWNNYPSNTLPDPPNNAMRIWLGSLGTGGAASLSGYGAADVFGGGIFIQRTGAQRVSFVSTNYLETLVPPGFVTVGCHGDSGGPLFGNAAGFAVALGIFDLINPDGVFCPPTTATQSFARLRTKQTWIESLLGFTCARFSGGSSGNYARCW